MALATGCASPPERRSIVPVEDLPMPRGSGLLRIGVEYLPPTRDTFDSAILIDGETPRSSGTGKKPSLVAGPHELIGPRPAPVERESRRAEAQVQWELERHEIRAKTDPVERMTLRFISELMGDDRKQVERAVGSSLLQSQMRLAADGMPNYLDERDQQDHQRELNGNGESLLRRPLRNALKELPLFSDVESTIDQIKIETAPRGSEGFGRISAKVRPGRLENPLELVWKRSGLRIGSSLQHLKVSYDTELFRNLVLRLRYRYDYTDSNFRILGSLEYRLDETTSVHASAGNHVNINSGPAFFPGGPTGDERETGVLFYVQHQF